MLSEAEAAQYSKPALHVLHLGAQTTDFDEVLVTRNRIANQAWSLSDTCCKNLRIQNTYNLLK